MQIALDREIVREYSYYCLGFVPADVIRLKKDQWFCALDNNQITRVDEFLCSKAVLN